MTVNENIAKQFVGIRFEYGKSSHHSCDCFGLFLLILQKYSTQNTIYGNIHSIFTQLFYNQQRCFEKINQILLPYSTDSGDTNSQNVLVVIKIGKRLHCGIIFDYQSNKMILHASEKNGVIISNYQRFFEFGTEIARYNIDKML